MILSRRPITLAEVKANMKNLEEKKIMHDYIKSFSKMEKADADKCAEEIRKLNNPKINEEHIVKLIDFAPGDAEGVSKIFNEISLTEEESNAIITIIKKY